MRNLFPGFYKRSEEELSTFWKDGIFVFDTNMLLNIYRYTQKTRERYLEILAQLKKQNQLWIPFQVAYEYQERRSDVIQSQIDAYTEVERTLQSTAQKLESSLSHFRRRHGFIDIEKVINDINSVINESKKSIAQSRSKDKREYESLKKNDILSEKLEELFSDNIGNFYNSKELENLYKQAQMRVELRIPPGWEDEEKKGYKKYGDIILWFQMIDYARNKKKPLIFVTDDGKKDWWVLDSQGKPNRPLPHLIQEMFIEAGVALHMYQGYDFIENASHFFQLKEQPEVVEEAKEVTERNIVELQQVKHRAPGRLYAGDVIQRIIQQWLEITYPDSVIIRDALTSATLSRKDFLILNPDKTRIGVELRYFYILTHFYTAVSDMLSIVGKGEELEKTIVILATGDFSYAMSMLEILEDKISIPENVSLIIGYIEPDWQFHPVATFPKEH